MVRVVKLRKPFNNLNVLKEELRRTVSSDGIELCSGLEVRSEIVHQPALGDWQVILRRSSGNRAACKRGGRPR